ncbi:unnamed protein product [Pylaiella littoralis]
MQNSASPSHPGAPGGNAQTFPPREERGRSEEREKEPVSSEASKTAWLVDKVKARLKIKKDAMQGQTRPIELVRVIKPSVTIDETGEVINTKESFKLNTRNLQDVVDQAKGMPIAIVSVVGALRSGKSFLLSCFLDCLEAQEGRDADLNEGLLGGHGREVGFPWKGGYKGHTQGMWVWPKPFIREVDDGQGGRTRMAVLLVDTQGLFDTTVNRQLEACLFGLATTLSSCQIFNVMKQVETNKLGSLAVFLEYGTVGNDNNNGGAQRNEAPFQRLEILIRDWQCWKEEDDPMKKAPKKLHNEFIAYLDETLSNQTTDSTKIKNCFLDRIGCFGLPDPGEKVTCDTFDGKMSDINSGFRRLLAFYIDTAIVGQLKSNDLPNLSNRGEGDFVKSVGDWVQLFSDGMTNGRLPDAQSWLSLLWDKQNQCSLDDVFKTFERDMDEKTINFVDPDELEKLQQEGKEVAMSSFQPRGDEETQKKAREALLRKLDKETKRMNERNAAMSSWMTYLRTTFLPTLSKACEYCLNAAMSSWMTYLRTTFLPTLSKACEYCLAAIGLVFNAVGFSSAWGSVVRAFALVAVVVAVGLHFVTTHVERLLAFMTNCAQMLLFALVVAVIAVGLRFETIHVKNCWRA